MEKGKLTVVDSPETMIGKLGAYAVDIMEGDEQKSRFFSDRDAAVQFLAGSDRHATLRNTTLEDVFVNNVTFHGKSDRRD